LLIADPDDIDDKVKLQKNILVIFPASLLVVCIVVAGIFQLKSNPVLSKSDLHIKFTEFQSYDQETLLLLDEYLKDKITFTYFSQQIGQIKTQVLSTTEIHQNNKIDSEFEGGAKRLNTFAIDYATLADRIKSSNGEKSKISEEKNGLTKINGQLDKEIKTYE